MHENVHRLPRWRTAAAQGTPAAWRQVFDGYAATVDWPGAAFWRELVAAFTDVSARCGVVYVAFVVDIYSRAIVG